MCGFLFFVVYFARLVRVRGREGDIHEEAGRAGGRRGGKVHSGRLLEGEREMSREEEPTGAKGGP